MSIAMTGYRFFLNDIEFDPNRGPLGRAKKVMYGLKSFCLLPGDRAVVRRLDRNAGTFTVLMDMVVQKSCWYTVTAYGIVAVKYEAKLAQVDKKKTTAYKRKNTIRTRKLLSEAIVEAFLSSKKIKQVSSKDISISAKNLEKALKKFGLELKLK